MKKPTRVGDEFDRLTVKRLFMHNGLTHAECSCSCGATTVKKLAMLRIGHVKSCGCLGRERRFVKGGGRCVVDSLSDLSREDVLYWSGFLFGDGSVDEDDKLQVCLTNANGAPDHLAKLSVLLFGENVVREYPGLSRCHLQATSPTLAANLARFGVRPNKTYDHTLSIPDGCEARHVLRGYFDADGWFSEFRSGKYVRHFLGLCSYRPDNLEIVRSRLPAPAAIRKKRSQQLWEMVVGKRDHLRAVVEYLKPEAPSCCLEYKWERIAKFLSFYNSNSSRKGFVKSRTASTSSTSCRC